MRDNDGRNKSAGARPAPPTRDPDAELATEVAEIDRSFLDDLDDDDRPVVVPSGLEEDDPTDRGRVPLLHPEPVIDTPRRKVEVRPVSARAIVERASPPARPEPARPEPLTAEPAAEAPRRTLRLPPVGGGRRPEGAVPVSERGSATSPLGTLGALGEVDDPSEPSPKRTARALPPEKLAQARAAERSSAIAKWGVVAIAGVAIAVAGVFVVGTRRAPIAVEAARDDGVAARELLRTRPSLYRSYKDEVQATTPDLVVRSPLPIPLPEGAVEEPQPPPGDVSEPSVPRVRRRGGGRLAFGFREPGANGQIAYGFEVPERPKKREYDTGDAPPPELRPMLLVFSEPPGVAVDVDGKLVGVTPVLRPVPPDKQLVDVRLWGGAYEDQRFTLKKGADGNFQLGVTMPLKPVERPREAKPRPPGQAVAGPVRREEDAEPKPAAGGVP